LSLSLVKLGDLLLPVWARPSRRTSPTRMNAPN